MANHIKQTPKDPVEERPIRILVVDDHKIFRQGLVRMLKDQEGMTVVGEAATGQEAVSQASKLAPDVVLMDISLPDIDGIVATKQILEKAQFSKVLALSMHSGRDYIQNMIRSGARGYLTKDCEFEELLLAVQSVYQGQSYLSPRVAGVVIESYVHQNDNLTGSDLSDREREVLHYIAEGLSTKKIADRLGVSTKTVETHRRQVMRKLGIFNVPQLTKYAIRQGLSSLES